jgi:arsenate reductase
MIKIYHNSRCSKSREALELVERFATQQSITLEVVEYLKTPPTPAQLAVLQSQLGCDLRDMVRSNEEEYAALGLAQANDAELMQAISDNPKLLQRPIVVYQGRALIGRPPELLYEFLKAG